MWSLQFPRAIAFTFGTGKLEWMVCNLVKVARWSTQSSWHDTSTWQTHRQPRRHSKCRANALCHATKTWLAGGARRPAQAGQCTSPVFTATKLTPINYKSNVVLVWHARNAGQREPAILNDFLGGRRVTWREVDQLCSALKLLQMGGCQLVPNLTH